MLVELVLEHTRDARGGTAIDVGTGSGAIALALAQEGTFDRVIGTDVSADALKVARCNATRLADRLHASVEFRHGSLLGPVAGERARAIVSSSEPHPDSTSSSLTRVAVTPCQLGASGDFASGFWIDCTVKITSSEVSFSPSCQRSP
ncbi:MAG: hypothetical protein B7Z72_11780, partial [Gemmatimonadetes bacterium 21-71-4]